MFKSKSFDLVTDDRASPPERFYQPCRVRWMKYILIPALVGFALLLILSNVEFSYEPAMKYISTNDSTNMAYAIQLRAITFCVAKDSTNKCSIVCDQNLANLADELDHCQRNCNDKLKVRLENCDFPNYYLSASLFSFGGSLHSLEIADCGQYDITDWAFNQQSFSDLTRLELINTQFHTLSANSFNGLSNVQNFTLTNAWPTFKGTDFLTPMADTLRRADIRQYSKSRQISEPKTWLGSSSYTQLTELNLAGNNFGKQLATDTFKNMPALLQLILAACGLEIVDWDLLSNIVDTLRYLDISDNNLMTLSADFVLAAIDGDLSLELYGNVWECSCLNADLLEYSRKYENEFMQVLLCATPDTYVGQPMSSCDLDCMEKTTNIDGVATSSSTIESDPTTYSQSTSTSSSTIESDPNTYSQSTSTSSSTIKSDLNTYSQSTSTSSSTIEFDHTTATSTTMISTVTQSVATESEEEWTLPGIKSTKITTTTVATPTTFSTTTSTTESEEELTLPIIKSTRATTTSTMTATETSPAYESTTDMTTDAEHEVILHTKLYCLQRNINDPTNHYSSLTTVAYDAVIKVEDLSNSHVELQLAKLQANQWQLLVFAEYTTVRQFGHEEATQAADSVLAIDVANLRCSTAYAFCLTVATEATSPYNCRSHRTLTCVRTQTWFQLHVVLITSLGTLMMLLCLAAGLLAMYAVLRLRPTWLRGSKRLVRPTRDTNKMLLLPKESADEEYAGIRTPNSVGNNCDYIAYYRQLEQTKLYLSESTKCNEPPKERAPSVPPPSERNSSQSTATEPISYIYECLELYEELS